GLLFTLLLVGRRGGLDFDAPWRRRLWPPAAAAVLVTVGGLAVAVAHARVARPSEELRIVESFAHSRAASVDALNQIAWTFATDPKAGPAELRVARGAAVRAVERDPASAEVLDTLATVDYRLGELDRAIAEERRLVDGQKAD